MRLIMMCISVMLLAAHPSVGAEPTAVQRCAALAAYIWEPGFRETGIAWDKIDIDAALPACEAANLETPHDPATLYRLARVYLQQKLFYKAMPLLLEAAEAGHVSAQTAYGTLFIGNDVPEDFPLALYWLERAAEAGNPVAKANLGTMYSRGAGVPVDRERYVALQLEAASAGVDFAQRNAGQIFEIGWVVERDLKLAEAWYRLASAQDYAPAQGKLGQLLSNYAEDQSDYDEAVPLLRMAADAGEANAATTLGAMFMNGIGVAADLDLGREAILRGYELGDAHAAYLLGNLYDFGKGVPTDEERALGYYLQAAMRGHAPAQVQVGIFVNVGRAGTIEDKGAALAWFLSAAKQGNVKGQVAAAHVYEYRFADEPAPYYDIEQAFYWYEVAAQNGDLGAALRAAAHYARKDDYVTAQAYVLHVLENGNAEMVEEAKRTIEEINFARHGIKIPI